MFCISRWDFLDFSMTLFGLFGEIFCISWWIFLYFLVKFFGVRIHNHYHHHLNLNCHDCLCFDAPCAQDEVLAKADQGVRGGGQADNLSDKNHLWSRSWGGGGLWRLLYLTCQKSILTYELCMNEILWSGVFLSPCVLGHCFLDQKTLVKGLQSWVGMIFYYHICEERNTQHRMKIFIFRQMKPTTGVQFQNVTISPL